MSLDSLNPLNRFHLTVVTGWFATLVVVLGIRLIVGGTPSLTDVVGAMLLGCIPAVVLPMVFRGAPPQTVAEVLNDTERTAGTDRAIVSQRERWAS